MIGNNSKLGEECNQKGNGRRIKEQASTFFANAHQIREKNSPYPTWWSTWEMRSWELGASEEQQLRIYMTILKVQRGMLINFQQPGRKQGKTKLDIRELTLWMRSCQRSAVLPKN